MTTPTAFYVYSDRLCKFVLTLIAKVVCPECGAKGDTMNLDPIPTGRGEWMLQCDCGEQFYNTND